MYNIHYMRIEVRGSRAEHIHGAAQRARELHALLRFHDEWHNGWHSRAPMPCYLCFRDVIEERIADMVVNRLALEPEPMSEGVTMCVAGAQGIKVVGIIT